MTTPTWKKAQLAVLSILMISRPAMADEDRPLPELSAGTIVRIEAPKTIRIPGVLTASRGRTEWSVTALPEDHLLLAATAEGWNEPIATPKPGGTLRAKIVSADASGLVVALDGRAEAVRIPMEAIARLDVSRGPGSRAKHALLGGAVGLGIGLAIFGAASSPGDRWEPVPMRKVSVGIAGTGRGGVGVRG